MVINAMMIIGIILLAVCAFYYYYYRILKEEEQFDIPENTYTIDYLVQITAQTFADMQAQDPKDMNLNKEDLLNKERQRTELREALKKAGLGDRESKEYIILCIRDLMRKEENRETILDIDENTIDNVIHFDNPSLLSSRDKFEIMMYFYRQKYDDRGLTQFVDDFHLKEPTVNEEGEIYYDITDEMISNAYEIVMQENFLSYSNKLDILARRIFAQFKGNGAIEILLDFSIDEIDCGVSGIPKDSYEIKQIVELFKDKEKRKKIHYSYKSIWIMLSALKIHLSFLQFESQKELIRVCQNIYKFDATEMLSRNKGYVIGTMISGNRIVVIRPPMASSWALFVRKFDSVPSIRPELLFTDKNAVIPITMIKWLIKGFQNMVISGGMGTGKTTTLKSLVRFFSADLAFRVFEISAELNLQYAYPLRNIIALQETEFIKLQEEMDLGMKLNSDITIIGEMASKESVSFYTESARKGSKMAIGTIHTNDPDSLIAYTRDAIPGYSNERAAEEAVVEALRIDLHLEKKKDHRYIGYIAEIVPLNERRYPSQMEDIPERTIEEWERIDHIEYMHRRTDRRTYTVNYLVRFTEDGYVLCNMPSERTMLSIRNNLTSEEEEQFNKDMDLLKKIGGLCG